MSRCGHVPPELSIPEQAAWMFWSPSPCADPCYRPWESWEKVGSRRDQVSVENKVRDC